MVLLALSYYLICSDNIPSHVFTKKVYTLHTVSVTVRKGWQHVRQCPERGWKWNSDKKAALREKEWWRSIGVYCWSSLRFPKEGALEWL